MPARGVSLGSYTLAKMCRPERLSRQRRQEHSGPQASLRRFFPSQTAASQLSSTRLSLSAPLPVHLGRPACPFDQFSMTDVVPITPGLEIWAQVSGGRHTGRLFFACIHRCRRPSELVMRSKAQSTSGSFAISASGKRDMGLALDRLGGCVMDIDRQLGVKLKERNLLLRLH